MKNEICAFHVGPNGAKCQRCGATWAQHFGALTDTQPKQTQKPKIRKSA